MKTLLCFAIVVFILTLFAHAQTETVVNIAGATVVEVITQNAAGVPTTRVLETIVAPSTSQTSPTIVPTTSNPLQQTTSSPTTTPQQVGPVGQPGTTPATPGGPTPYSYTTTDANGNQVVVQAIFTPTGPQTALPVPTTTGVVLNYSQWLSMIGGTTASASAARRASMSVATGWYYFAATIVAGIVGGAWLIVL